MKEPLREGMIQGVLCLRTRWKLVYARPPMYQWEKPSQAVKSTARRPRDVATSGNGTTRRKGRFV